MNILIVDDDPIARLIIDKNLRLSGITSGIETAENGLKAMELIENSMPKVILLDLNMPLMSGFEVLEKLKTYAEQPLVYIITSSTLNEDRVKCSKYECVRGFFEKPVNKVSIDKVAKDFAEKT